MKNFEENFTSSDNFPGMVNKDLLANFLDVPGNGFQSANHSARMNPDHLSPFLLRSSSPAKAVSLEQLPTSDLA